MRLERGQHGRYRCAAVVCAGAQRAAVELDVVDARDAAECDTRAGDLGVRELDLDRVAVELALELVGRAVRDDPSAIDDREPRGEPVGLLEVVGGEQDRHPLLGGQTLDLAPHLHPRLGVEPGRRLIEEQHLRPVQQAHRDVQPALHAAE